MVMVRIKMMIMMTMMMRMVVLETVKGLAEMII